MSDTEAVLKEIQEYREADLMAAILAEEGRETRRPGDIVWQELMAADPLKRSRAYWQRAMDLRVLRGEYTAVEVYDQGHIRKVYRKV
jgi:hypothetical protein